jgi:LysR family transcriptional regulator for metE and metH
MEQLFAEAGFIPSERIEIGSNETIKQAVMAGMGVGFLSLHTAGVERAARRLVVLPVVGTPVMRQWFVINRHQQRLTAAAAAFRAHLVEVGAREIERALAG